MPIFYEVTAPNGKKSYLFGTMHLEDKEINTVSFEVKQAFETASALYVEVDITSKGSLNDWYQKHDREHSEWAATPGKVNEVVRQIANYFPWYIDVKSIVRNTPPLIVIGSLYRGHQNLTKILDSNFVSWFFTIAFCS